jgi:hypothetical protein
MLTVIQVAKVCMMVVYTTCIILVKWQQIMNLIGWTRKWSWPNLSYSTGICLKGLRKTTNTSVRIVGAPDKVQIGNLPNIIRVHCLLCQLVQFSSVQFSCNGMINWRNEQISTLTEKKSVYFTMLNSPFVFICGTSKAKSIQYQHNKLVSRLL